MKTIKQIIIFIFGTAAGVGLFSLMMLVGNRENRPVEVSENAPAPVVMTPPQVQRAASHHRRRHAHVRTTKHHRAMGSEFADLRTPIRPRHHRAGVHSASSTGNLVMARNRPIDPLTHSEAALTLPSAALTPPVQPAPTVFKSIGYAEQADGQLVAFILQEDHVQLVHVGDRIADRYRVTTITQEAVSAIDDASAQVTVSKALEPAKSGEANVLVAQVSSDIARLHPARVAASISEESSANSEYKNYSNSIGYVEKSNGSVDAVVAVADTVRLIPARPARVIARSTTSADRHEVAHTPQSAPRRDSPEPTAVGTSVFNSPTGAPGLPEGNVIVRPVVYEDSSPADDEAIPNQSAIVSAGGQNP